MIASNDPRQDSFLDSLAQRLIRKGYDIEQKTIYHLRVNGRLDLYPVNRKYHDILKNERGTYQDIFSFVDEFFFLDARQKEADSMVAETLKAGAETLYVDQEKNEEEELGPTRFNVTTGVLYERIDRLTKALEESEARLVAANKIIKQLAEFVFKRDN